MRIALLANAKHNAPTWDGMPPDQWDDLDAITTIEAILASLERAGHEVAFFEAQIVPPHNVIERLLAYKPDLCFNVAEGHFGDGREAQIPALLEMLRLPYTGSRVMPLSLTHDKPMTKRILMYHGLPTPEFQVFDTPDDPIDEDLLNEDGSLRFSLFVKPSREGTSIGVTASSIVNTVAELRAQVAGLQERYQQPILCEHYIKGREITVGVLGNVLPTQARRINERAGHDIVPDTLTLLPPLEVNLDAYDPAEGGVYTNNMKHEEDYHMICPAPLSDALAYELRRLTAAVFRVTGCRDVARVDFRLDANNGDKPYILEINALPGLTPGFSDLWIAADAAGWTYDRIIHKIVELAAERYGLIAVR